MKTLNLTETTEFVLEIRSMTTSELCNAWPRRFPHIEWSGSVEQASNAFLARDARLWDIVGEYSKLMLMKLDEEMLVGEKRLFDGFKIVKYPKFYDPHIKHESGQFFCYLDSLKDKRVKHLLPAKPMMTEAAHKKIGLV